MPTRSTRTFSGRILAGALTICGVLIPLSLSPTNAYGWTSTSSCDGTTAGFAVTAQGSATADVHYVSRGIALTGQLTGNPDDPTIGTFSAGQVVYPYPRPYASFTLGGNTTELLFSTYTVTFNGQSIGPQPLLGATASGSLITRGGIAITLPTTAGSYPIQIETTGSFPSLTCSVAFTFHGTIVVTAPPVSSVAPSTTTSTPLPIPQLGLAQAKRAALLLARRDYAAKNPKIGKCTRKSTTDASCTVTWTAKNQLWGITVRVWNAADGYTHTKRTK